MDLDPHMPTSPHNLEILLLFNSFCICPWHQWRELAWPRNWEAHSIKWIVAAGHSHRRIPELGPSWFVVFQRNTSRNFFLQTCSNDFPPNKGCCTVYSNMSTVEHEKQPTNLTPVVSSLRPPKKIVKDSAGNALCEMLAMSLSTLKTLENWMLCPRNKPPCSFGVLCGVAMAMAMAMTMTVFDCPMGDVGWGKSSWFEWWR